MMESTSIGKAKPLLDAKHPMMLTHADTYVPFKQSRYCDRTEAFI